MLNILVPVASKIIGTNFKFVFVNGGHVPKIKHNMNKRLKSDTKTEATYKIEKPYKMFKLENGPPLNSSVTTDEALKLYENMLTIRIMENMCADLYKSKIIRGFCHLYAGQEAIGAGLYSSMKEMDTLITSYRCHAYTWLMGGSLLSVISELTGRKTGCSRGKGGSMHMYGTGFYGGNGIVGSQVPLGVGVALAQKYKETGGVCLILYGDGAANQGQVFEAMNIAKLWTLPCLFVCENNRYGMGTVAERSSANTDYYTRGDYIPGLYADGMDVIACRDATLFCLDYIKSGKGPLILEVDTYRYYGHSMSDPGTSYRTRDEVKNVRKTRDPIVLFQRKILEAELVTKDQLKAIKKKVKKDVQIASEQSKTEPEVGLEELAADIFKLSLTPNHEVRGIYPGHALKHISVHSVEGNKAKQQN